MPIKCKSCGYEGAYKVAMLLAYKAKCQNCGSNFDYAADSMNGLVDELNEDYELLQMVLGIQEFFRLEYQGREIEEIKTIQDLLSVTESEFGRQGFDREKIRQDLLNYLESRYNCKIKELDAPILSALGIKIEKRKRS